MDGDNFKLEKLRFKTEISGDNSNRFRREKFRAQRRNGNRRELALPKRFPELKSVLIPQKYGKSKAVNCALFCASHFSG